MQPQTRSTFLQRLGYYAFGLAVGFVMLGLLWNGKDVAAAPAPAVNAATSERVTPAWAKPHESAATGPVASGATPESAPQASGSQPLK